jgi:hypothetical protein
MPPVSASSWDTPALPPALPGRVRDDALSDDSVSDVDLEVDPGAVGAVFAGGLWRDRPGSKRSREASASSAAASGDTEGADGFGTGEDCSNWARSPLYVFVPPTPSDAASLFGVLAMHEGRVHKAGIVPPEDSGTATASSSTAPAAAAGGLMAAALAADAEWDAMAAGATGPAAADPAVEDAAGPSFSRPAVQKAATARAVSYHRAMRIAPSGPAWALPPDALSTEFSGPFVPGPAPWQAAEAVLADEQWERDVRAMRTVPSLHEQWGDDAREAGIGRLAGPVTGGSLPSGWSDGVGGGKIAPPAQWPQTVRHL